MVCGTKLRIYKTIFTRIQPNSLFLIALKNKKHFDIIICGGGAAGLLLAHGLIQNNAFDHLSIALIEKEQKNQNDRTWCFWEEGKGKWDHLVSSRWDNAIFQSKQYNATFSLAPYQYKMIEGINFYNHLYPLLEKAPNLDLIQAEITEVNASDKYGEVTTREATIREIKYFLAFLKKSINNSKNSPSYNNISLAGLSKQKRQSLIKTLWSLWILTLIKKTTLALCMYSLLVLRKL